MLKNKNGFTIVELLVVIVVIGILASITVVAYGGIQRRAENTARVTEVRQYEKIFQLYKASFGSFPQNPSTAQNYCLGTGFPENGTCGDIYWEEGAHKENVALMNELRKVSSIPSATRKHTNYAIGPYVNYNGQAVTLVAVLDLPGNERCSNFSLIEWYRNTTTGTSFCAIELGL